MSLFEEFGNSTTVYNPTYLLWQINSSPTYINQSTVINPRLNPYVKIFISTVPALGILLNLFTGIVLTHVNVNSQLSRMILYYETIFDGLVCIITLVAILVFHVPSSTNAFICIGMHGGLLIRFARLLDVCNMITMTLDRFWAIVYPSTYRKNMQKYMIFCGIFPYVYASLACLPVLYRVRFQNHSCILVQGDIYSYLLEIIQILVRYVGPIGLIVVLSVLIVRELRVAHHRHELINRMGHCVRVGEHVTRTVSIGQLSNCCVLSLEKALLLSSFLFTVELTATEIISIVLFIFDSSTIISQAYLIRFQLSYRVFLGFCAALNPLLIILPLKTVRDTIRNLGSRIQRLCICVQCCDVHPSDPIVDIPSTSSQ
ncbi:unnamed protein product [Echinostoma caproni]|uniref:G_PROTEIN_RECEP_F1_2 domain-containing protein n=1 Tax=Echinostoma caproni TaxID=27848 RepID=A0A183AAV8_9TREM|nr:unnamed protein product [Echinostoma caproni]